MLETYECGDLNGKPVIYFHGAPGAIEECRVFDKLAKQNARRIICVNRFAVEANIDAYAYYQLVTNTIIANVGSQKIDIVGFSIGALIAVKVSQILGDQVDKLHLISAAAPLNGGDFLPKMAGKPIFELAKKHPNIFAMLVLFQSLIVKIMPSLLFKMLFSSAVNADAQLVKQAEFKAFILPVLQQSYKNNGAGFIRDVKLYVNWQLQSIKVINAKTFIWHGEADNWSPIEMADCLAKKIETANVEKLPNLSHYSTLYAAVPLICRA